MPLNVSEAESENSTVPPSTVQVTNDFEAFKLKKSSNTKVLNEDQLNKNEVELYLHSSTMHGVYPHVFCREHSGIYPNLSMIKGGLLLPPGKKFHCLLVTCSYFYR